MVGRRPQRHCGWPAGQASKRHPYGLRIAFPCRIVSLIIENVQVDDLMRRLPELIHNLAAVAPPDGEVMIRVGTVVDDVDNELIAFRIVVHSPKCIRHHGGSGSYHRHSECNAGQPFPSKRAHPHGTPIVRARISVLPSVPRLAVRP